MKGLSMPIQAALHISSPDPLMLGLCIVNGIHNGYVYTVHIGIKRGDAIGRFVRILNV
jgi:hypothetical protein